MSAAVIYLIHTFFTFLKSFVQCVCLIALFLFYYLIVEAPAPVALGSNVEMGK